ncbi:MAG: hypothetical protein COX57_04400 [Alphaproteobacteria bacterium CG_4_10_14_0_2_um_filter_63_37]|nr:MAG: hypothetical protein AUJ55_08030 [Proteobacteria bacterium CG1_02_64_396]PJA25282.1 MAG: hypothetical protein COX57_04400 [Alphaproteobacteria bacterium CG_4_10_14_0_2_um_filter_63_37]
MALARFEKDPASLLDYSVDWSKWLADQGDILASSVFTIKGPAASPSALVSTQQHIDTATGRTLVWLSGGSSGEVYQVVNAITTAGGRRTERTFAVKIVDR